MRCAEGMDACGAAHKRPATVGRGRGVRPDAHVPTLATSCPMLRTLTLAAALLLAAPAGRLGAQMQVVNPPALDSSTPRAQRARAVADLVLGGDRAKLDAWLKEHGAPD